ncbi:peptidoglycan DD-metalloendopeptidase family protein [Arenibacter sp. GZD96]|uniref:murein hydrolase activator EnvC family protein n=1 Tax=Aurantibrevibacter litoralis TaxID=3106030 RepID=UPI002AFF5939|nr:peptidoglycan DD-metalloendopeptidase family protein [Arenibacter sp. GZD-96]MEA1786656.1 peptidoglycan DD-metalloendopeptidase family protein [Arenibacter sp. GZD-96]
MLPKASYITYLVIISLFMCQILVGQTSEQKALESKRERLQQEIKDINRLLFAEKKEKGNVLDQMEALDQKLHVREQLIRVTNEQANILSRQINTNIRNISKLREDLETARDDYATMIQRSYQNRSQQSRLMFLLSSESFLQAFKRLQYMKQYAQYRKEQGQLLAQKAEELSQLNQELSTQRKDKERLMAENMLAKKEMLTEKETQKQLLNTIRKNESKYSSAIQNKQKEAKKIEQQIEALIRSAIVSSNKASGNTSSSNSVFAMTPEASLVATNFSANKGKLIWPVEKGIKSQGFGVYNDKVYPGIKHESNGVIIATDAGSKARAIFEGEVIAVLAVPGGNRGVQIKHGNFISTYYNLSNLYVKKGDKVSAKAELGEIYTNRSNGLTQLKFYLYQNTTRLNPEDWLFQL